MGCGLISQRGPSVEVHHPISLDPGGRAAGARVFEHEGEGRSVLASGSSYHGGAHGSQGSREGRSVAVGGGENRGSGLGHGGSGGGGGGGDEGGAHNGPPGRVAPGRRFVMGERIVVTSRSPSYAQDHAFCFECGSFFQLAGAGRAPQCSRCGSSFVQFLRPPGNEHWIRADSTTGLSYSFDDQLENSITASLEETPCQRRPTQGAFLRTLPTFVLSEEEVQSRRKLDCKDPKCGCAICREGFCIGDLVKRLPCNHEFHDMCIVPWLKDRSTCPICRCKFPEAAEGEEDEDGVVCLKCGGSAATTAASVERDATPEHTPPTEHGPESDDGVPSERTGNSSTLPGAEPQPGAASLETGGGSTSVVRLVAPVDTSGSS